MNEVNNSDTTLRFEIYRAKDGVEFKDNSVMYAEPVSDVNKQGWPKLSEAGYNDGHETKLLFSTPGFSLIHAWFKSRLPLPRHSHNVDCLYYVVAGSLKIGTETLGPGDGFFIGKNVPYAYTPGEAGVEVLEFRSENRFSIKFLAESPAFWAGAVEEVRSRRDNWADETRPTAVLQD